MLKVGVCTHTFLVKSDVEAISAFSSWKDIWEPGFFTPAILLVNSSLLLILSSLLVSPWEVRCVGEFHTAPSSTGPDAPSLKGG